MKTFAFLTPTFGPDLERCELLVESLDRFAPEIHHYLIVDRHELRDFGHLRSSRTTLVPAEDILGIRQLRVPLQQNFWLHPRTLPMRGWMRQQLLKMAATAALGPEVLYCLDSDVSFVRPFRPEVTFDQQGRLGLLDVDYVDDMVRNWTARADRLLGLPRSPTTLRGHVGHLIAWSRDHMCQLHDHVERATGLPWQIALGRNRTISEYVLYGVFIREVLGYERSGHHPSTLALVRQPWAHDLTSAEGLQDFICRPDPDNVAVMVHSKFGIPVEQLRPIFEKCWNEGDRH